jgi:hypothetical protein
MCKIVLVMLALALAGSTAQAAITLGQVDTFQDGTTQGWGGYAAVTNVSTGGPAGSGDKYLSLTSTGEAGRAGELRAATDQDNRHRWAGNYINAGVTGVEMDLKNFSTQDLQMRIVFGGNYGDWTSANPFVLPADGQWHHVVFGLTSSDLVWGGGGSNPDLTSALTYMGGFSIRHQAGDPLGVGQSTLIAATVGIDNVTAAPEPLTILLCAIGGIVLAGRRIAMQDVMGRDKSFGKVTVGG